MLLLVVSVSIKIANGYGGQPDQKRITKSEVAAFFSRHGFRVDTGSGEQEDSPIIQAATSTCELLVIVAAPQGWHRDLVRRLAAPQDTVFFVVGGEVLNDQPQWRTSAYHYWRLVNRLIGHRLPVHPVLGVVASHACDVRGMPWREVAEEVPQPNS